jgi:AraC-like DNA-binding protein
MIRMAPLGAIPALLRELGVAPEPLLRAHGIDDLEAFKDPEATMPFAMAGRLLKTCAERTLCPYFGLLVGQWADTGALGSVGLLLRNAPDVITALNELVVNLDLHDRGATCFLEISGNDAILGYEVYVHGVAGIDQVSDCAMAVGWNIMRTLCGPAWLPSEVRLRHDHPLEIEPYRRFFNAPLKFNAEHSSLVFPASWLAQPTQLADPNLRQDFLSRIQDMRTYADQSFREQAYKMLVMLLGQQRCTREQLAEQFAMHSRTLTRRLKDAGTSFRELHGEACHEMARQLLRDTRRNLPSIALRY